MTVRLHRWERAAGRLTTQVHLETTARFPDNAICLWDLPLDADLDEPIQTSAKEMIPAWNLQGEGHLVLRFDLEPAARIPVSLRRR